MLVLSDPVGSSEMTCPTEGSAYLLSSTPVRSAVWQGHRPWGKGPVQEGAHRPQRRPGGSHGGPPTPLKYLQDSRSDLIVFLMASQVAFSAPGFPCAVSSCCPGEHMLQHTIWSLHVSPAAVIEKPACLAATSAHSPFGLLLRLSVFQHQWL